MTNNKYSICLTTFFDKNFQNIGNICLKSMKKYADKYGYDIRIMNDFKTNRPAPWFKIKIIEKLLNDKKNYDFVFWIDADALFVRFDEDIGNEIIPNKDLYLVKHFIRGREVPNTGSFLIRNSEWSKEFLKKVWSKKEFIYNKWWENGAVNYLLGYRTEHNRKKEIILSILYKLKIKNLVTNTINKIGLRSQITDFSESQTKRSPSGPNNKNIEKVGWLNLKWNSFPEVPESTSKKPIINHYPAMPYEKRLKSMIKDFSKIKIG